jgi:hypothetical protein
MPVGVGHRSWFVRSRWEAPTYSRDARPYVGQRALGLQRGQSLAVPLDAVSVGLVGWRRQLITVVGVNSEWRLGAMVMLV